MTGVLQPLGKEFPIINPDGTPTEYFIRWAQQRQIDIGEGINQSKAQALIDAWAAGRQVIAGTGLDGGGYLSADVTLDLADTAVIPGTYGSSTKSAVITVDQQGRLTDVTEATIAGGGGGGSIFDAVKTAEAAAYNPVLPQGGATDLLVTSGSQVALVFHAYTAGTTYVNSTVAQFTVPVGMTAFATSAYPSKNVVNDNTYYKHRLYNVTTGTVVIDGNSPAIGYNGSIEYDAAVSTTLPSMLVAGVAGDVLIAQAASGPDAFYRTVNCFYVLTVA